LNKLQYDLKEVIGQVRKNIEREPFTKEDFRKMIIRTYEDWFCDYSLKWDVRDYLEVVEISNCV